MPVELANTNLFKPIKLGNVLLKNRLAFAPLTRFRNDEDGVATNSMLEYYTERAENNGGLIITEGTMPSEEFGVSAGLPYANTARQIEAWGKIVDSIHKAGSFASLQFWSMGATSSWMGSSFKTDALNRAAKEAKHFVKDTNKAQVKWAIQQFAAAASKAIKAAGFDFVELNSCSSTVPSDFFEKSVNKRTDEYGGSTENRARFILETLDAMIEAVGAEHVALKISPFDSSANSFDDYVYLLKELEKRADAGNRLAYLLFCEPRVWGGYEKDHRDNMELTKWIGEIWKGPIVRVGALLHDEKYRNLKEYVDGDDRTLIAVGRYFSSNPDLPERLRKGYPLTSYDRAAFYTPYANEGYLGWAKYGEKNKKVTKEFKALV